MLKWPVGFGGCIIVATLVYRIAPNCKLRVKDILPGAVWFTALWFLLSQAFGTYVSNFSYYNRVTGTLGCVHRLPAMGLSDSPHFSPRW